MLNETLYPNLASCQPQLCANGRIRKVHRAIANVYRQRISPFGLTGPQLSILFITSKVPNVTQSRLSEILIIEKSTVSRNIRNLVKMGVIEKEGKLLSTNTKGKELLERVIPEWQKAKAEVLAIIGPDGNDALNLLINKLIN